MLAGGLDKHKAVAGPAARAGWLAIALLLAVGASPATARQPVQKSIWGPVRVDGVSQFPIYRDLGVGIFQI